MYQVIFMMRLNSNARGHCVIYVIEKSMYNDPLKPFELYVVFFFEKPALIRRHEPGTCRASAGGWQVRMRISVGLRRKRHKKILTQYHVFSVWFCRFSFINIFRIFDTNIVIKALIYNSI